MSSDPTFWIEARASGLLALLLLTASVIAGLVLKSRPFGNTLKPAAVTDIHRFLAMLCLGATAIHGAALVLDSSVHISVVGLLRAGLRAVPSRVGRGRRGRGRADGARLRLLFPTQADRREDLAEAALVDVRDLCRHGGARRDERHRHGAAVGARDHLGAIGAVVMATARTLLVPPAELVDEARARRDRLGTSRSIRSALSTVPSESASGRSRP